MWKIVSLTAEAVGLLRSEKTEAACCSGGSCAVSHVASSFLIEADQYSPCPFCHSRLKLSSIQFDVIQTIDFTRQSLLEGGVVLSPHSKQLFSETNTERRSKVCLRNSEHLPSY